MEKYIAGFFDGEGNINKLKVKGKIYYQLRMYQSGEKGLKLLKEIKNFLGYGNIYYKKNDERTKNTVWELTITKSSHIDDFKRRIGIFCRIKEF